MIIWLIPLLIAAYLIGSIPAAQIAARLYRGIDLRQHGTGQVGGGNLWRLTSWRLGFPVGVFDFTKGLGMVWVANLAGLDIAPQILVGSAVIIGHNWSVFLRFSGGRGLGTTIGVVSILPIINEMTPWATVSFLTILVVGSAVMRSSPVAALASAAALPIVSWLYQEPIPVVLSFLVIFLIIVIKRLTAPLSPEGVTLRKRELMLNRFLFDRDISDRRLWMYRNLPSGGKRGKLTE